MQLSASEGAAEKNQSSLSPSKKSAKFWLIFTTLCICVFLSAFELVSISTALPTIANALHTTQFTWVGSAYALAASTFLPVSGNLAQTYGRRPAILVSVGLFALGSGICGGSTSMAMLIAGRTIQGLGCGGIWSLTSIILSDLVPLQDRGTYAGLYALTWCLAASIGPLVGGSLATQGQWRWYFYLNLPIAFVVLVSVVSLFDLPIPSDNYKEKFMRMDWTGIFLVISSTAAHTIGLTWGGITAPWGSATVLVPLVVGLIGFVVFIVYEATLAKHPLMPLSLMTNITSVSGFVQTFCVHIITSAVGYYFPVYFQACKGASPVLSGIHSLPFASLGPAAIIAVISVNITGRYRPQVWLGWVISIIGFGLMSMVRATDPVGLFIGYVTFLQCGLGILNIADIYPILASIPVTLNAPAITFASFLHLFATTWGITIGSTILQNTLAKELPSAFVQSVPQGTSIAYALIPDLSTLDPQMRHEVQVAFANSLAVLWRVCAAVSGAGLLVSLFMRGLRLHSTLDSEWTLTNETADQSI